MSAAMQGMLQRLRNTPILQAPMVGVSTPALAAAVSNAGALGAIGIGASSAGHARQMIRATRALTAQPFNVNVFCHKPAVPDEARETAWLNHLAPLFAAYGGQVPSTLREIYRSFVEDVDVLQMLIQEQPAVVSFHFGLPPLHAIAALRNAGIVTFATATSLAEARLVQAAGIDGIVAQGFEAGGHRSVFDPEADADDGLSTLVLVRLLVANTRLPVIAAGGIMDGQGICAALDLGAVAAQLGTAFILCPESSATPNHRALMQSDRAGQTRVTSAISGRPARGIVNRYFALADAPGSPRPAGYPMAYDAAKQLHALAAAAGNHAYAACWAGQGAPLARALPAADLVAALIAEMR